MLRGSVSYYKELGWILTDKWLWICERCKNPMDKTACDDCERCQMCFDCTVHLDI